MSAVIAADTRQIPQAGPPDPLIRLAPDDTLSFTTILKAISAQSRVAFVAEGEPLSATLTDTDREKFPRVIPLSALAAKVADAFDYEVEQRGSVFLLRKRYSNPHDLPSLTWEECLLSAQDVLRVASRLHPHVPAPSARQPNPIPQEIMRSLSPEQMAQMATPDGLPVARLSAGQQAQAGRIARYYYLQMPLENVEGALKQIKAIGQKETAFCWRERQGVRLFGYETLLGPKSEPTFKPLSPVGQVRADFTGFILRAYRPINGTPASPPPDPSTPSPEEYARAKSAIRTGAAITLEQAVAALNDRPAPGHPVMEVDPTLARKTVTVVGAEHIPRAQAIQALADIYDLRIRSDDDGAKLFLTRPLYRVVSDISALPEALLRVFPRPLLRAFIGGRAYHERESAKRSTRGQNQAEQRGPLPERVRRDIEVQEKVVRQHLAGKQSFETLRTAAIRRLRALVEPKIEENPDGRVLLSSLGNEEYALLALIWMADCVEAVDRLCNQPIPDYMVRFNEVILKGGLAPGKNGVGMVFSLFICGKNREGKIVMYAGQPGVPYRR